MIAKPCRSFESRQRLTILSQKKVSNRLPPPKRDPSPATMLITVVHHVAALTKSLEIFGPVVRWIMIEVSGREHDFGSPGCEMLARRLRTAQSASAPISPGLLFFVPPATIAQVLDLQAMRTAASFTSAFRSLKTDDGRQLRPIDRIEPFVLRMDRHGSWIQVERRRYTKYVCVWSILHRNSPREKKLSWLRQADDRCAVLWRFPTIFANVWWRRWLWRGCHERGGKALQGQHRQRGALEQSRPKSGRHLPALAAAIAASCRTQAHHDYLMGLIRRTRTSPSSKSGAPDQELRRVFFELCVVALLRLARPHVQEKSPPTPAEQQRPDVLKHRPNTVRGTARSQPFPSSLFADTDERAGLHSNMKIPWARSACGTC